MRQWGTHHEAALQRAVLLAVGTQAVIRYVVAAQVGQKQADLRGGGASSNWVAS